MYIQVETKKVNNKNKEQTIYDTNMALLTAYEALDGLGGKRRIKISIKICKSDQRQDVASVTDAQKNKHY